jgi:hypothetical protein
MELSWIRPIPDTDLLLADAVANGMFVCFAAVRRPDAGAEA